MTRDLLALALLAPAALPAAQDGANPVPAEVRLSEAEKERVLEEAAERNRGRSRAAPAPTTESARPIQGEVGVSRGTGGYRSAYGTTYVPVGKNGVAVITLGSTEQRDQRNRRAYHGPWLD